MQKKYALISVSDKEGIFGLANALVAKGYSLVASGGTFDHLVSSAIPVEKIENAFALAELFDGRVKTLSRELLGGILFDRSLPAHCDQALEHGIPSIDVVVCNFYPFLDKPSLAMIDIGGPTMVRAAAKNHLSVYVLCDKNQYAEFILHLEKTNPEREADLDLRRKLCFEAFSYVANYDRMIADHFNMVCSEFNLRYGENPHQRAKAILNDSISFIHGGENISYNNLLDVDAAIALVAKCRKPAVAVLKHNNPCGFAQSDNHQRAFTYAWEGDPKSAFGSIVAINGTVDQNFIPLLKSKFIEVIVAADFTKDFVDHVVDKKHRTRLCRYNPYKLNHTSEKICAVATLTQEEDLNYPEEFPTDGGNVLLNDSSFLRFSEIAAGRMKSNAIAITLRFNDGSAMLLASGVGQQNRVDCLQMLAGPRSVEALARLFELDLIGPLDRAKTDCLIVSDGFIPFPDLIDVAHRYGYSAIMQPGGSKNDQAVVDRAAELGISMLMTGRRHFLH